MPRFKLHTPGRWGENNAAGEHYSQVMEIDGGVELSGQGGWHPATLDFPAGVSRETDIQQAFENVAYMLKDVGLSWSNVGSRSHRIVVGSQGPGRALSLN